MDTLHTALYDAFREAGTSEEKARAAAAGFPPPEQIATKTDIARLEIKIAQLETKISEIKEDLTVRIMWAQGVTIGVLGVLITTLKLF